MEATPKVKLKGCCRHLSKPLHGYSFYIDVEDDEDGGEAVEILVEKISSLGGNVRHILTGRILYFITARKSHQRHQIRRSARFMKQNETRAKTKLRNVPISKKQTIMSTVDRARKLGISIFTIEKVTKWLKEIERRKQSLSPKNKKQYEEANDDKNENVGQSQLPLDKDEEKDDVLQSLQSLSQFKDVNKNNDEELQPPFIKVEDKGKVYEPQYLELTSFPSICFENSMPRSPFQKLHFNGTINSERNSELVSSHSSNDGHKTISSSSNYSKSGYCDFCESFFRYRDRHIRSKKHQLNIPYENFKKLDDLIKTGGSFNDFLKTTADKKISREMLNTMERKKMLNEFLKTLEGKRKAREFFRNTKELNGFVEYSGRRRRKEVTGFTKDNGRKVIR